MTPKEIREIREGLGLSQEALGKIIGVSGATISNWEIGKYRTGTVMNEQLEKIRDHGVPETEDSDDMTLDESLGANLANNGYASCYHEPAEETAEEFIDCETCLFDETPGDEEPCSSCEEIEDGDHCSNYIDISNLPDFNQMARAAEDEKGSPLTIVEFAQVAVEFGQKCTEIATGTPSTNKIEDLLFEAIKSLSDEATTLERYDVIAELNVRAAEIITERGWK